MQKILWLDTETTGLDPSKNGLIEIAGIIEFDGIIKQEFDIKMDIMEGQVIDEGAAKIHGLTIEQFAEQIKIYQAPLLAYRELIYILDDHVDRYDKTDKLMVAGYNVGFDISFLEMFFRKMGNNYLYSYIKNPVDILHVVRYLSLMNIVDFENHKLETVCAKFGIPLEAHNPMSDIRATRELAYYILNKFGGDI